MAVRDTAYRKLSYEDYLLFPEDGDRHELIAGEHCVSPAPLTLHQRLSMRLGSRLHLFVDERGLGQVLAAPVDVVLSRHDVVQPDLLFLARERLAVLTERNVQGAPDLVVEIASNRTRHLDEGGKRDLYERSGVREYWLVDPQRGTVTVYRRGGPGFLPPEERSAAAGDLLSTPLLPGFALPLAEIFGQQLSDPR